MLVWIMVSMFYYWKGTLEVVGKSYFKKKGINKENSDIMLCGKLVDHW